MPRRQVSPAMIRNVFSMYFDRRRAILKPALVASALLTAIAAPAEAAGQGQIAAAGEKVAGLTLTAAKAPSPLPTTLPAGHPYRPSVSASGEAGRYRRQ